ncbi:MAG TPA: CBS domain-containing protein, partial [Planctomycetota bacterium]
EPLPRIRERFADGRQTFLYVLDKEGRLDGVISTSELFPLAQDADVLKNLTVAQDIAAPDPPSVTTADTLDQVLTKLDLGYRDELPMLDDGRFVGTVRIEDILNRYRAELFRHETAQAFADSMESTRSEQVLRKVGRHAVAELDAPAEFYGRTLAELDMRHKFGINVLLIKSIVEAHAKPEPHVPVPEYRIGPGDRLVVFGLPTQVERLSRS